MLKYHVLYIEGASPQLAHFRTKAQCYKWIAEFLMQGPNEDNWIDLVFEGNIIHKYPTI